MLRSIGLAGPLVVLLLTAWPASAATIDDVRARGRLVCGVSEGLPGFSDSNWFRTAFPDCVAYGFMPAREFDLFQAMPLIHGADERVPVQDLGFATRFFAGLAQELLG